MNATAFTGNLTADPEKVELPDGNVLVNFRFGNSEWVNGESKDNGFFDATAFGAQAENIIRDFKKGARVIVVGRLQHRTYEKADGTRGGRVGIMVQAAGLSLEFAPKES